MTLLDGSTGPATEGKWEVWWRNPERNGFTRCGHAHATPTDTASCLERMTHEAKDETLSPGIFVAQTHIHSGGTWHDAGEVVPVNMLDFAGEQEIWRADGWRDGKKIA